MTPDSSRSTHAGQAVYAPATLALYDFVVLRVSNSLIWRCPTANMLDLYNKHAADNHLDVGVGTGWYLDRCRFPTASPRVALMDLNQHSLDAAARRIARYRPETHRADILAPVNFDVAPFASISLTYLLHCLPGDMASKAAVFDTLAARLRAGGVMFGATLLSEGVERSAVARALMGAYNRKGIFSNTADGASDLRSELDKRFTTVDFRTIGCTALFAVRGPR